MEALHSPNSALRQYTARFFNTMASFCKGTRASRLSFPDLHTCRYCSRCTRKHSTWLHSTALQSIPLNLVSAGRAYLSQQSTVVQGLVDELKRSTQQQKVAAGVGAPALTPRTDPVDALTREHILATLQKLSLRCAFAFLA